MKRKKEKKEIYKRKEKAIVRYLFFTIKVVLVFVILEGLHNIYMLTWR